MLILLYIALWYYVNFVVTICFVGSGIMLRTYNVITSD